MGARRLERMKRFVSLVFLALACSLACAAQPLLDVEKAICVSVNSSRQQAQVGPVVLDPVLSDVARKHSEEMLQGGYFGHNSPNDTCRTLRDRLRRQYRFCLSSAENLYKCEGYDRNELADSAMSAWLESPVHHKNLVNRRFNRLGIGVAQRGDMCIFTQVFSYEPVIVQSLEVVVDPSGYLIHLTALVAEGSRQGGLFVEGKRLMSWEAGPDGTFQADVRMTHPGTLDIGQLVGTREWSIETEIPIPPPNAPQPTHSWLPWRWPQALLHPSE